MSNDQCYVLISNVLHTTVHQVRHLVMLIMLYIVLYMQSTCYGECQNCMKENVRYLCDECRNGRPLGTGGQSWAMWDGRSKFGHVRQEVKVEPLGTGGQS